MKLLYLSDGASVHDTRMMGFLIELGCEVHCGSFKLPADRLPEVTYHSLPFPGLFFRSPRHLWLSRTKLVELLHKLQPDILQAAWVPTYGFLASLSGFHPFVLEIRGSDILLKPRELFNFSESYLSVFNRLATQIALLKSDRITCESEYLKHQVQEMTGLRDERLCVIPRGVDLTIFRPGADDANLRGRRDWESCIILFMNRAMEPLYGWEYFLDALSIVFRKVPETRALLCGTGSLEEEIRSHASDIGIDQKLHFAGFVRNDLMPHYLNACDIYVSTSLSEGLSVSLQEAMACGLPLVVTDNPAVLEWVRDCFNGYVIPRRDSSTLARRLVSLASNRSLRGVFGERNARIARERADGRVTSKQLFDLYDEAVTNLRDPSLRP